jgi:hypothetical protein
MPTEIAETNTPTSAIPVYHPAGLLLFALSGLVIARCAARQLDRGIQTATAQAPAAQAGRHNLPRIREAEPSSQRSHC